MSTLTTMAIVRAAACALAAALPSLAAAQSLYDDPRPKKHFPPTLTPAPAARATTALAFDTVSCGWKIHDCAPKSIAPARLPARLTKEPTK